MLDLCWMGYLRLFWFWLLLNKKLKKILLRYALYRFTYWHTVTKLRTYSCNSRYSFCYHSIINVYVLILINKATLKRVRILIQNGYSTKCDIILLLLPSYSNCLCISPLLLATFVFYSIFPSKNMLYNPVPTQDVTNPLNHPLFHFKWDFLFLLSFT